MELDDGLKKMWWDAWGEEWVEAVNAGLEPPKPPPFPRTHCVDCGKRLEGKEIGRPDCVSCNAAAVAAELRADREREDRAWDAVV